ncbi:hypothetical protein AAV94_04745 [Lampropedia cohaerens]|uniref:SAM-dependent MTase RsmB/NOP-type domain-containing protein n=1 Tax=Lampropedia cohaerens TaxID=1610491 RepID=A0A0U1Q0Z1_9BURK|nr:RsmB/NOP family class I SAM-dependent RNA methyltransferase [Lampropedia cohaerens]KKW68422.1 hypothetical protein AAV94_04745 [Lampropedia cohaerens]
MNLSADTAATRNSGDSAPARYLVEATAQVLEQVGRFDAPADAQIAQFLRAHGKLGARDRQRLGDAVYAALRHWRLLAHWLAHPEAALPAAARTRVLALLALAAPGVQPVPIAEQTLRQWLARAQAWAPPQEADWLVQLAATQAYATSALPTACQHNLPDWLAKVLQEQYGQDEFWQLLHTLRQPAPLDLRVNLMRGKRDKVLAELRQQGIAADACRYSPWGLRVQGKPALRAHPLMQSGAIEVQDEGSQLLAVLTDARRGETVIDFCAGAGGKTLALGAMMRGTGRLYAFDSSAHRLAALAPRLARSGLQNVHTMALDDERDERLQRLRGKADRVLVDAPCSGLGTLRRHPDLAWRLQPEQLAALQARQLRILQAAHTLLKPGGTLVYATCSLLEAENQHVKRLLEAAEPQLVPHDLTAVLRKHGLEELAAGQQDCSHLALLPHLHQTDGFFIAAWRKQAH